MIQNILSKPVLEKEDIVQLLASQGEEMKLLLKTALETKLSRLDNRR